MAFNVLRSQKESKLSRGLNKWAVATQQSVCAEIKALKAFCAKIHEKWFRSEAKGCYLNGFRTECRASPKGFKFCPLGTPIFFTNKTVSFSFFFFFQVICLQFVDSSVQTFCWKLKSNRCHKSEIFIQFWMPYSAVSFARSIWLSLYSSITFMCFGFLRAFLLLRALKLIYVAGKRRKTKIMKATESRAFHAELCLSAGDY